MLRLSMRSPHRSSLLALQRTTFASSPYSLFTFPSSRPRIPKLVRTASCCYRSSPRSADASYPCTPLEDWPHPEFVWQYSHTRRCSGLTSCLLVYLFDRRNENKGRDDWIGRIRDVSSSGHVIATNEMIRLKWSKRTTLIVLAEIGRDVFIRCAVVGFPNCQDLSPSAQRESYLEVRKKTTRTTTTFHRHPRVAYTSLPSAFGRELRRCSS